MEIMFYLVNRLQKRFICWISCKNASYRHTFRLFLGTHKTLQKQLLSLPYLSASLLGKTWLPVDSFSWILCLWFSLKIFTQIQVGLKFYQNKKHFIWRPMNMYMICLYNGYTVFSVRYRLMLKNELIYN